MMGTIRDFFAVKRAEIQLAMAKRAAKIAQRNLQISKVELKVNIIRGNGKKKRLSFLLTDQGTKHLERGGLLKIKFNAEGTICITELEGQQKENNET
jgi:hypothetical protein